MRILIETVPHATQRYDTCGDWQWVESTTSSLGNHLHIRVSALADWRYEALVAVHELIEALLCRERGITEADVDRFDHSWALRGADPFIPESGDDPLAPYYREHQYATAAERALAVELRVYWQLYERALAALAYTPATPHTDDSVPS